MRALADGFAVVLGSLFALFLATGCQPTAPVDGEAADALARLVSGHTSGIVSRKSEIRVLFATDVVAGDGAPPKGLLATQPPILGNLEFRSPRELVLTPAHDLQPGREYRVTLTPARLALVDASVRPYSFTFHVQLPEFDVRLQELAADPVDDTRMILRGAVLTADAEDGALVEGMLRAAFPAATLATTWRHVGREHWFTLTGLERRQAATRLSLIFDGEPIGSYRDHEREVWVPAASEFVVANAIADERGGRDEIRVSFSSRLDEGQDLSGLVRLSAGEFTTRVDGNGLTIYPLEKVAGAVTVTLEPGIRNARGGRLEKAAAYTVSFGSEKPQLRFVGTGVILPDGATLTVPFEAVNARSVRVVATRVYPENLPQFLQVNTFGGTNELGRVGRHLWRKTLSLGGPVTGRWQRYDLDVSELVSRYPGSLFQLSLQLTPADSAYPCPAGTALQQTDAALRNQEDGDVAGPSTWDYVEDYFGVGADYGGEYAQSRWRDRDDPCKPAYYAYAPATRAQRSTLASNFGLLAKSDGNGRLFISVTDLRTAEAKPGVELSVRNYQNQVIGTATSDDEGLARVDPAGTPFLLIAQEGERRGYLKLNAGTALPVSHFDVGGEAVREGLKGAIYGERGIWRPGDALNLTFVVHDRDRTLPANHPATLELIDPRGRGTATVVNATPIDGFYRFDVRTAADAPTGDWTAKVTLGGATFRKSLKIETVMPNRLRVALDVGERTLKAGAPLGGTVRSEWLSGASAAGLKADVSLRLVPASTRFERFTDYTFDDPAREFRGEPEDLFAGELDATGSARFERSLEHGAQAPGMLRADFTTRVFERGGAFSINHESRPYAPYARFVGLRLPKGDVARGMLLSDQDHVVEIGTLDAQGNPLSVSDLQVSLEQIEWRWWWDRSAESLAQYVARSNRSIVSEGTVTTDAEGRGRWTLRVDQPRWGRFLLRVCDKQGGHCAGSTLYIDWPYWAGREREQAGPAASMLNLTSDKASYQVGDNALIQLPESSQGRALVTIENGSGILAARWATPTAGNSRITIPVTSAMTPNAYVSVTLVQPHEGKTNDRPIRLYGVVPLVVTNQATHLQPVIAAAAEWRPESTAEVEVREAQGRAMTYTLAVVDEGLLSLTSFRTPDLHQEFFRREALGVRTWDVFDQVIGAYGAQLERLLALGGSSGGTAEVARREPSRFPPVAQLLGPFKLEAGAARRHAVTLPRYVGAVRVMLVAGDSSAAPAAFGSAEQSVAVRQPLTILPTMPRVIGPNEEVTVPVSVFAMDASVRDVSLAVQTDGLFEVLGDATTALEFDEQGEKLGLLKLRAAARVGRSRVRFTAVSGEHRAVSDIDIEVRSSNPATTRLQTQLIAPGERWTTWVSPHGMPGTNRATLEMSALPPLNIEDRLQYLIQYPHGCLEQTTSSVFPQLFLSSLMELDDARQREVERNVRGGIERLAIFQIANGGFTYWPDRNDGLASYSVHGYALWATTYASHFLVEAEHLGYSLPAAMRAGVIRSLRGSAQMWPRDQGTAMDQAYRLYVLARAGEPEIGAMNRLREERGLGAVERWTLAAAYRLAGLKDAAVALADGDPLAVRDLAVGDRTFGSALRDHGLVLQSMVKVGVLDRAEPVVRAISDQLGTENWYSTQAVAFSLLAMSQLAGADDAGPLGFEQTYGGRTRQIESTATVHQAELAGMPDSGAELTLRNTSASPLFATVAVRGIPEVQHEGASATGLSLTVRYTNDAGEAADIARLTQGSDVVVDLEVRNTSGIAIDNIALTQIVPAGWEILNDRIAAGEALGEQNGGARNGVAAVPAGSVDHSDIRDDRVLQYFSLQPGEVIRFTTRVNAAYRGRYYLPGVLVEAMYDATKQAQTTGQWVEVVAQ